jgi:hypothetical protein
MAEVQHAGAFLREWFAALTPERKEELKKKFNSCSWVTDPAIGNFPEKPKKIHLEKLHELAK